MKVLAIETSCDDTSLAIVEYNGKTFEEIQMIGYSQIADHQDRGGVVPELASRLHSEKILQVLAHLDKEEVNSVDAICVTAFPGLAGSLMVWLTVGEMLSNFLQKPLVKVNHIYWHIFSMLLGRSIEDIQYPLALLTASGGHNDIYVINHDEADKRHFSMQKLGQSIDDAAGEAFDKVSRMLGWPYPGGAWIGQQALSGEPSADLRFKRAYLDVESYDFSFSWMKSQVYNLLSKLERAWAKLTPSMISNIAYEFQEAMVEILSKKLYRAASSFDAKTIAIVGGVSANKRLFEYLNQLCQESWFDWQILKPTKMVYSMDNAAMIGVAGIIQYLKEEI